MKGAYRLFLLLIFNISSVISYSQDFHFSQYTQTPALINPALTGAGHTLRASLIYKDQWGGVTVPYKTFGASLELKFKASNWEKAKMKMSKAYNKSVSKMAGGISFFSDKAGDGNMGTSQVNLSLSSFVPISKKNILSFGLQTSVVQRKIDFSKLIFTDQYNGKTYDPNVISGENESAQNYIYPDVGAGVNWNFSSNEKSLGTRRMIKTNVGVSMFHINQPKQKFLVASDQKLNTRFLFHGDFLIGIKNTNLALVPSYLLQFQGASKEIMFGMICRYSYDQESKYTGILKQSAYGFGAALRNRDALIISAYVESGQYTLGFSYDLNTSKLTYASTGRGGPEIFLRFITPNPFLYQMKTKSRYKL
ncbi:MAG: PorP/SprF family type IX secretion system membrane protein [Bacteroidia bacterium]|nr:PorP/SprF family type IX secretion system membrane protein [Bacteroidia bacterium]